MIAYSDLEALGTNVRVIPKLHAAGKRIFVDFADRQIASMLDGLEKGIITKEPQSQVFHDVRLLPLQRTTSQGHFFAGGLFKDDKFLDEFVLRRGRGPTQTSHVEPPSSFSPSGTGTRYRKVDTAWFGGYLFNKYGHFLLESLSRLLDREAIECTNPIIFFSTFNASKLPRFVPDIFHLLGIDPARILSCDEPMEVGSLRILDLTFQIKDFVNLNNRRHLQRYPAPPLQSGALYLSRTKLDVQRKVSDEGELERLLADSGAASVIHPELLIFSEQLCRLSSVRVVSGCEGSAFHSLIFLNGARTSLMFCGTPANRNYVLCDEIIDGDSIYVNCGVGGSLAATRGAWTVDAAKVFRIVRAVS